MPDFCCALAVGFSWFVGVCVVGVCVVGVRLVCLRLSMMLVSFCRLSALCVIVLISTCQWDLRLYFILGVVCLVGIISAFAICGLCFAIVLLCEMMYWLECLSSCVCAKLCIAVLDAVWICGGMKPMYMSWLVVWYDLVLFVGGCGIIPCVYV